MFRKTIKKVMALRKQKSDPEMDSCTRNHYDDESNSEESEIEREFRHAFIDEFESFRREADLLSRGNAEFEDSWKDTLGKEGLAISLTVIVGVIGLLGAIMVISAAASAGAAIPVAVIGIVAGIAFYKAREHIKQERFRRADELMERSDISECIRETAKLLTDMYQLQLASCTVKDAHKLAKSCMEVLSQEMLKNKDFNFAELLSAPGLQGVLMRSLTKMPKMKLDMNLNTSKKFNTRGMISHTAYYCRETNEFYRSEKSKSAKYGVLFFDKKEDLDGYEAILAATMKGREQWKFTRMRPHEVHALMKSSIFKAYQNDALFEGNKKLEVVEKPEGMKI